MKKFEFSIIASGLDPDAEDFESRFYDAGCDDALVAYQKGHTILDFAREAPSLEDAIASAVKAASEAGATVNRVEPDPLVSLADISARTGLTRSAMTHYAKGARGKNFPAPVAKVTTESPLWDWAEVARWMYANNKIELDAAVAAEILKVANDAIGAGETELEARLKSHAARYAEEISEAA